MKYSGVIVSRDKVDYGYVVAGEEAVFRFIVATFVDYGVHVLSAKSMDINEDYIEKFADSHSSFARLVSHRRCHTEYMDEVLRYVRSLPRGCRYENLFSKNDELRARAEGQIGEALLNALAEEDSFQAAVVFEAKAPYLRADRKVVDLMDRVVADASRFYLEGEVEYLVRVAEAMEAKLVKKSPFFKEQVSRVKACVVSAAPAPAMR
jgi:hypothetical protein|nr:hypothetical protein [Neorhizobium tomejilense]